MVSEDQGMWRMLVKRMHHCLGGDVCMLPKYASTYLPLPSCPQFRVQEQRIPGVNVVNLAVVD